MKKKNKIKFSSYKQYMKYLVDQNEVDSDAIEKMIDAGLVMKVKTVSVDGYEAVGFRMMSREEFYHSDVRRHGVIERIRNWLKGDK